MHLPSDLEAREAQIRDRVTADLRERGTYNAATDDDLIASYARSTVEADRLTEEARRLPPDSPAANRLQRAAVQERKTAATLANRLGLTAAARRRQEQDSGTGGSLLALMREHGDLGGEGEPDDFSDFEPEETGGCPWNGGAPECRGPVGCCGREVVL